MKLRHIPAALLLLTLPTLALARGWIKDPHTGCEIFDDLTAVAATWDGACSGGKASGNGTATYKYKSGDRDVYNGEMEDGKPHGQGVYIAANGGRYEGQFKDGKRHGQGVYVWKDGDRYEGAWKNDQRHGLGKETKPDGSLYYEGQWANGQSVQVAAAPAPAPARSTACDHVYVGKEFDSKLGMYWLKFHWRVQGVNPNTGRATVRTNEIDSGKSEEVSCDSIP